MAPPTCLKETWISQLPKVLIFSINRVHYDPVCQKLVKSNKRFDFEKVIYADRFIIEHRQKEKEIKE